MAILKKNTRLVKIISTLKYRKNRFGNFTQKSNHWCATYSERKVTSENEVLELCARLFEDMEGAGPEDELQYLFERLALFTQGKPSVVVELKEVVGVVYEEYKKQNRFESAIRRWFYKKLDEYLPRIRKYLP